jgi:hypothetical protein
MEIINLQLKLSKEEYPILFQLKENELEKTIYQIFNTGYVILYPKCVDTTNKSYEYKEITQKIELLRSELNNPELNHKINSLESSLEKLIGLSTSSSKKGELAENILENIFEQRYGDITFKNTSQIAHSGDAWLYLPNDKVIMLESKNYTNCVNKDEVIKMQNDMITHHIKWGIFVSFNSSIQGMKEFDFHIFHHNNETYNIVMISNLSYDISRLDLGISLTRKLLNTYADLSKFPWIVNNIKTELDHLNELLEQNYLLRDNFLTMEKDVIKNINSFYTKLRDYQFIMDTKIKEIISKITSTMDNSINYHNLDYTKFIELAISKDKKLGPIATKISDTFKQKNIVYSVSDNNLLLQNNIIGCVKIQTKKITLEFTNYDILLNFMIGKDKEIIQNLQIINFLQL